MPYVYEDGSGYVWKDEQEQSKLADIIASKKPTPIASASSQNLASILASNPWMNSSIGPQYNRGDARFAEWEEQARRGYGREGTTEGAQPGAAPWLYDANGQAYIRKQVSTPDGRMAYQNFDPFTGNPISEPDVVLGAANMAEEFGGPPGGAASGKTVPWSVVASGADLGGNGTDRYTAQGVRESDFFDNGLKAMIGVATGFGTAGAIGAGATGGATSSIGGLPAGAGGLADTIGSVSAGGAGSTLGTTSLVDIAASTAGGAGAAGAGAVSAGGIGGLPSGSGGLTDLISNVSEGGSGSTLGTNPNFINELTQELSTAAGTGGSLSLDQIKSILTTGSAAKNLLGGGGSSSGSGTTTGANSGMTLDQIIAPILGYLGSTQQANTIRDLANQARTDRAPFLSAATGWLNNPQSYYDGPGKSGLDATLRALSVDGNPLGSGTSMALATEAGMRDWRNAVTGFGNMGLAGEDTRAQLGMNAAGADANALNAIGAGVTDVFGKKRTLADIIGELPQSTRTALGLA